MGQQVGTYIQRLRRRRGLSIRQLSDQIGVSSSYLSLIERGRRDLSITTLYAVVKPLEGDFVNALHLLALDAGVPTEALSSKLG